MWRAALQSYLPIQIDADKMRAAVWVQWVCSSYYFLTQQLGLLCYNCRHGVRQSSLPTECGDKFLIPIISEATIFALITFAKILLVFIKSLSILALCSYIKTKNASTILLRVRAALYSLLGTKIHDLQAEFRECSYLACFFIDVERLMHE